MPVRPLLRAAVAACALAAPALSPAQQTPQISEKEMAVRWASGRYVAPVTCTRNDGSLIELEEAITVRKAPEHSGGHTLKATFFGIDVADVSHCQNLMEKRLPDRRGVLYFTFRGGWREDLGLRDFRQNVASGGVTYHVQSGRLHVRPIGGDADETRVIDYGGSNAELRLADVAPRSDGGRMLARLAEAHGPESQLSRRFELRIDPPEGEALPEGADFRTFILEDSRANARANRRRGK